MSYQQKLEAFRRSERECSRDYFTNITKQARVEDTAATISAVARQPWARQTLLAGHSEGTHVATGVLNTNTTAAIAAGGLFASAGPVPFYGVMPIERRAWPC
jgi:hypothetical protein